MRGGGALVAGQSLDSRGAEAALEFLGLCTSGGLGSASPSYLGGHGSEWCSLFQERSSSTSWGLSSNAGFYPASRLPWLSGVTKLTAFATSSRSQLNSSCTVPELNSSNLQTDQGMDLRNALRMVFVLSAHRLYCYLTF